MKSQAFAISATLSLLAVQVLSQGVFNEAFCSCDLINVPVVDIVELGDNFCSATTSNRDIYECNFAGTCSCARLNHMPTIQTAAENASGIFECAVGATSKYLSVLSCAGPTPTPSPPPGLCMYETGGSTGNANVAANGKPYLQLGFSTGALVKTGQWTVRSGGTNFLFNTRTFLHTNAGQYPDPITGVLTGVDMRTTFMYLQAYTLDSPNPNQNRDDTHVAVSVDQPNTNIGNYQQLLLCSSGQGNRCNDFAYETVAKMNFFKTGTSTPFTIGAFQMTMQRLGVGERVGIPAGGISADPRNPSSYALAASTLISGPTAVTATFGNVTTTNWLMFDGTVQDSSGISAQDISVQAEWRDIDEFFMYYRSELGNAQADNDIQQGFWDYFLFTTNPVCVATELNLRSYQ